MIQSMTGYGKADCEINGRKITIEIKSLNSKQLDLSTRVPSNLREKEIEIRNIILGKLERGKVELNISYEQSIKDNVLQFNEDAFKNYLDQLNTSAKNLGITPPSDPWSLILKLPDVLKTEDQEIDEQNWIVVKEALEVAIDNLKKFRIQEGKMLESVFNAKVTSIERLLDDVKKYETERITSIKTRIMESMAKIGQVDYDKNRFEQEMIYYIEKLDINEEKERLANHCKYFRETMDKETGQGKKLGFISQEMGREINTLGSKSNHTEMQKIVVCMKDELEQIKEQVLNVL